MRLKLLLSAMTLFFVCSIAFIPHMVLACVTRVELTTVGTQTYQEVINCNGEIVEKDAREIYLETPVIASDVRVQVGDRVYRGQTLAVINKTLTQNVLEQQTQADVLAAAGGTAGAPAVTGEMAALARRYGFSEADVQAAVGKASDVPIASTGGNLAYVPSVITAPISGIVTQVSLQTDVMTQSSRPVITVSDSSAYAALVSVGEADVAKLCEGDSAIITGAGFDGKSYTGSIRRIYPVAHKALSGTVQQTVVDVELVIDSPDEGIKPGFTAKAMLFTQNSGDMLAVPYEAIGQEAEDNREYVYVYAANRIAKRYITTGRELTDAVEILEGLGAGERVVLNPGGITDEKGFFLPEQRRGGS